MKRCEFERQPNEVAETIKRAADTLRPLGVNRASMVSFQENFRRAFTACEMSLAIPSTRMQRFEIENLERQALGYVKSPSPARLAKVSKLLAELSSLSRENLNERGTRPAFRKMNGGDALAVPTSGDLNGPNALRACELIIAFCVLGREVYEGRRRAGSGGARPHRSRSVRPILYRPPASQSRKQRIVLLEFVSRIQEAYQEATGLPPPQTANHSRPGPFANMVQDFLWLLDDECQLPSAVTLINQLSRARTKNRPVR